MKPHRRTKPRLIGALLGCTAAAAGLAAELDPTELPLPEDAVVDQDQAIITPIQRPIEADLARVALGRTLFADPRLSRAGNRSCQCCHDLATNGATARAKDVGPDGTPLGRNTITVFNAALNIRLNWNGEIPTLEAQAEQALTRADLMAETWPGLVEKLRSDTGLAAKFEQAYGRAPDRESILDAIAVFERSLLTPDSRFDTWLRGNRTALSEHERVGYDLFRELGCASCHQGVNVGGNLFQKVGIFGPLLDRPAEVLRVPSLRNVAVTAPYFDDGSVPTLPEAVRKMAKAQLGRELTDAQTDAIVAFLGTLTGSYDGRRLTAPR